LPDRCVPVIVELCLFFVHFSSVTYDRWPYLNKNKSKKFHSSHINVFFFIVIFFFFFTSSFMLLIYLFFNLHAIRYVNWCSYLQANENDCREDHWTAVNDTSTMPVSIIYSILGYSQIWLNEAIKIQWTLGYPWFFLHEFSKIKVTGIEICTIGGQIFSHAWCSLYKPEITLGPKVL
jgi:hypothetical protein